MFQSSFSFCFKNHNITVYYWIISSERLGPNCKILNTTSQFTLRKLTRAIISTENSVVQYVGEHSIVPHHVKADVFPETFGKLFSHLHNVFNTHVLGFWITGEVFRYYYISYDRYIPKNLTKKLNRLNMLMMENGLKQFYSTMARFKSRICFIVKNENKDIDTMDGMIGLEQLKFLFIFYGLHMSVAIVAFVIELIVHRLN